MRKYIFLMFIIVVLGISLCNTTQAKHNDLPYQKVIIDVGHGGKDPGTSFADYLEKDINLQISLYLEEELNNKGIKVLLTRYGDYDLSKPNARYRKKSDFDNRINLINNSHYDLYISIHLNYLNDSRYFGPQVFYDKNNYDIAIKIQNKLNESLSTNRKVKNIPSSNYMYEKLTIPGVLIECGFMSNDIERKKLIDKKYQKKIAEIIADSLEY